MLQELRVTELNELKGLNGKWEMAETEMWSELWRAGAIALRAEILFLNLA
jgi:hypothetical protein